MIRAGFAILAGAMFTAGVSAQTETSAVAVPSGTAINVQLNSSVDSKKAKAGDQVAAHTTEEIKYAGKTIVPLGAKLEGRVTEAKARSKGDSGSTLAIQFDKVITKKGEEISLNVVIVAIAAPQRDFSGGSAAPDSDPMSRAGAAAAGGSPMSSSRPQNPTPGAPSLPSGGAADPSTGSNGSGQLPASSRGVYGLHDLKLMGSTSRENPTTIITSSGKNVHLDSGTRLLLVAQAEGVAAPGK
jgi:hypothetical protein